jgi:hypothetical protein
LSFSDYTNAIQSTTNLFKSPLGGILGTSGALEKTPWAFFSNPAGLSELKGPVGGIGYQNDFNLQELNTRAIFLCYPFQSAIFSGGFTHSGFQYFNTRQYHLALSKKMAPWLNMGLRINSHHRFQTGSYNHRIITVDAGWQLTVTEKIHLGCYMLNPARSQWHLEDLNENHSVVLAASMDYIPVSGVRLEAGLAKEMEFPPAFSLMIEHLAHKTVTIKGTAVSAPLRLGIGTGILWQSLGFDAGLMHHETLGFSSSFGILYHMD